MVVESACVVCIVHSGGNTCLVRSYPVPVENIPCRSAYARLSVVSADTGVVAARNSSYELYSSLTEVAIFRVEIHVLHDDRRIQRRWSSSAAALCSILNMLYLPVLLLQRLLHLEVRLPFFLDSLLLDVPYDAGVHRLRSF